METPNNLAKPNSRYQEYLPALLQNDAVVEQFLQAFEQVLSGSNFGSVTQDPSFELKILQASKADSAATKPPGLEEVVRHVHLYFNPDQGKTPTEFLPWLASWVALSLREDWGEETKRRFIRSIVPIYQLRGTKAGMEKILRLYLGSVGFTPKVIIYDQFEEYLNYFQVQLTLPFPDPSQFWQQARIIRAIIDQEKPAHTYYALRILTPTMQITGQMYPFKFEQTSGAKQGDRISRTVEIKMEKVEKAVSPQMAKLAVNLQGAFAQKIQSHLAVQQLTPEKPLRYEVKAEKLEEGWQVTLKPANQKEEVALRVQSLDTQLYLTLKNLSNVQIEDKEKNVIREHGFNVIVSGFHEAARSQKIYLHRALQIYRQDNHKRIISDSGTTHIFTETGAAASSSTTQGA